MPTFDENSGEEQGSDQITEENDKVLRRRNESVYSQILN